MYNINRQPIHKVKSKIYIAEWLGNSNDDYGNTINIYDEPQKYMFNVQTLNESVEMEVFGRKVISSKVISITNKKKYLGKFKEYDLVYIDNIPEVVSQEGEEDTGVRYGDNADYFISGVRNQNTSIRIYLTKLTNKQK